MRLRITNIYEQTCDVHKLSFESAGALEFVNEYSGFAVAPAHYIAFAELKHARPAELLYHCGSEPMRPMPSTTSVCKLPATRSGNGSSCRIALRPSTPGPARCDNAFRAGR